VIHLSGDFDLKDIENEIRAGKKLSAVGTHKNIVSILQHGKLPPNDPIYFIDMELCHLDLGMYIAKTWTEKLEGIISQYPLHPQADVIYFFGQLYTRGIMKDITRGLAFIHLEGEIHRDIKPANGIFISFIR
jgi:serine/threonine protein kinase